MQLRNFSFRYVFLCVAIAAGNAQQPHEQDPKVQPNPHAGHQMPPEKKEQKKQGGANEMDHSQMPGMDHSKMPGMDHSQMPGMHNMMDMNDAGMLLMNQASGTSMNPRSWPMPMLMTKFGSWHSMFMGNAFIVDTQQSGPRGHDKFYSPNWFMGAAEHSIGSGSFMF